MTSRWSPAASAVPPAGGRDPSTRKPSGRSSARTPSAADRRPARNPVAFLDPQLARARDLERPAQRRPRRQHGQLVDEVGHLLGRDHRVRGAWPSCATSSVPTGSPPTSPVDVDRDPGAHPRERAGEAEPARVEAQALDPDRRPGQRSGRGRPDGGRGRVPGHWQRSSAARWPPGRPTDAVPSARPAVDVQAERGKSAFRMIACRQRLGDRCRPVGGEAGQHDGALDLGARHRRRPGDRPERAAVDDERRAARRSEPMRAPIAVSGSITRRIGRRRSDSSPVTVVRNGRPARSPASRRIVVPELPASSGTDGAPQAVPAAAVDDDGVRRRASSIRTPRRAQARDRGRDVGAGRQAASTGVVPRRDGAQHDVAVGDGLVAGNAECAEHASGRFEIEGRHVCHRM